MADEKEEPKAKWAAEAYAFLALFRRLHRRVAGLLMLELGWGLLLRLVNPLLEGGAKATTSGTPVAGGIPIFEAYLIGAAVIAAYWLLASGTWKIAYLWLARLARPSTSALLVIVLILVGIVALPLILLAMLVDHAHFHYWLRKIDPAKLSSTRANLAEDRLKELYEKESKSAKKSPSSFEDWQTAKGSDWVAKEQVRIADPVLYGIFEKQTKWRLQRPWEATVGMVGECRLRLDSVAIIGLAPFHSYSFEEEQKSAKAPLQIFATAIRRLRLGLNDPMIVNHLRFMTIPEIITIESEDAARRWRRWLGLDTLLWGSYLSTEPPRIWLNVENRRQKADARKDDSDRAERIDWNPLRTEDIDFAMMEVDQDDQIECYLVVLLCFLRTLQRRPRRSQWLLWKKQDVLELKKYSGERTFLQLVRPLLPRLKELPQTERLDGSPAHLLIAYISNWAAYEVTWAGSSQRELQPVSDMLRHCIRLEPTRAEHHYRLGALLCLLDDEPGARTAFTKAQALDRQAEFYSGDEITIYAGVHLDLAYRSRSNSPGGIAAAVAFVARAIKIDSNDAVAKITKDLVESEYWQNQQLTAQVGMEPTWSTADRILCSLLGVTPPKPSPKVAGN